MQFRQLLQRSLPGIATALITGALHQLGFFQSIEQIAYNTLFRLRGAIPWDERVVLVGVDDKTLQQLGQYPLPRRHYATLLQKLTQAEPNVVVFDLVFSEPSSFAEDRQLAEAIAQHGSVVLAQAWKQDGQLWQSIAPLRQAAVATGHIAKLEDADGITRKIEPQRQGTPALSIAAIQVYSLVHHAVALPDLQDRLWLNWVGQMRQASHYSFVDVVQGRVPAIALRGKIVMVGSTATGIDPLPTPFDRTPPASGNYLHANAINNLLQTNFLHPAPDSWFLLIFLIGGPGLSLMLMQCPVKHQLILWLGLCLSWLLLSGIMLRTNYWLPTGLPLALFSLTTVAILTLERLQLELENRTLQHLATSDTLTKIANRHHFDQYLDYEWHRSARTQSSLALILCDVDFFKRFNDHYGHQAGDNCLMLVAAAIKGAVKRPADLVARYGGEEFVVILPDTDVKGAVEVAERIRAQVKALAISHAQSTVAQTVSLSLGVVSTIPHSQGAAATLIATADQALYRAKAEGRDRSVVASW
ncbi:MAG: diguanylate cyclase [Lyngbya sp. HA4199-MV5]|jgi:diguanylate cyclase (GGDEF)-like protein|nr:diguanylate cyclase [Lyngbya sp. HA4199-MV5]